MKNFADTIKALQKLEYESFVTFCFVVDYDWMNLLGSELLTIAIKRKSHMQEISSHGQNPLAYLDYIQEQINKVKQLEVKESKLADLIIDKVLNLAEDPTVQKARLSGFDPSMRYNDDDLPYINEIIINFIKNQDIAVEPEIRIEVDHME